MTLNDILAVILRYFIEFGSLWEPDDVTVVEVRPPLSANENVAQK